MGPNSRRSIRSKSSPRGMGLRKPNTISNYRNRKAVFADQKQVETLHKGYQALDGGGEGSADTANGLNNLTYRKAPMKVAVRIRPLNARETTANARGIIQTSGPNMLVFDPERKQEDFFFKNEKIRDVTARKYKNLKFAFDHVYDVDGTNAQIYNDIMQPLIDHLLSGFNCSVFAYGATGSGKTYTMLGSPGNPGLTYLTLNDVYNRLESMASDYETGVQISYFEVYNEQVRDLLNPTGKQLTIMEVGTGITIKDLSFHRPENLDQLLEMLKSGNANRSQHPTDHNAESSRSHAVLQVQVGMRERHKSLSSNSKECKLVMVDLAGSEKGSATQFSGQRFREGSSINKSLLALGKIMEALALGKKTFSFRDSKLTRILKDSLGGNCRTVMIANISPSDKLYEDTLNTLRYAQKAKKIACNATKNVITVQSCLTEYTRVVNEMTEKIKVLEQQLKERDETLEVKNRQIEEDNAEIQQLKSANEALKREYEESLNKVQLIQPFAVDREGNVLFGYEPLHPLEPYVDSGSASDFILPPPEGLDDLPTDFILPPPEGLDDLATEFIDVPQAVLDTDLNTTVTIDKTTTTTTTTTFTATATSVVPFPDIASSAATHSIANTTMTVASSDIVWDMNEIDKLFSENPPKEVDACVVTLNAEKIENTLLGVIKSATKAYADSRPSLESTLHEIQLKVNQYLTLRKLHESTSDPRFEKTMARTLQKLEQLAHSVNQDVIAIARLEEDFDETDILQGIPFGEGAYVKLELGYFAKLCMDRAFLEAATGENKALSRIVERLVKETLKTEGHLLRFALLANKMYNTLQHYDHLAPTVQKEYKDLVLEHYMPHLQFARDRFDIRFEVFPREPGELDGYVEHYSNGLSEYETQVLESIVGWKSDAENYIQTLPDRYRFIFENSQFDRSHELDLRNKLKKLEEAFKPYLDDQRETPKKVNGSDELKENDDPLSQHTFSLSNFGSVITLQDAVKELHASAAAGASTSNGTPGVSSHGPLTSRSTYTRERPLSLKVSQSVSPKGTNRVAIGHRKLVSSAEKLSTTFRIGPKSPYSKVKKAALNHIRGQQKRTVTRKLKPSTSTSSLKGVLQRPQATTHNSNPAGSSR